MTRRDVERAEYIAVVSFYVATCASVVVLGVCIAGLGRALGWW